MVMGVPPVVHSLPLSNECRWLVAQQFPRVAVIEKLTRESELAEELFDLLV